MKKKLNILITDNDAAYLRNLKDKISTDPEFNICGIASDGESAINIINDCVPDVMIIDMVLPKKDGIEVMDHLFKIKRGRSVNIIATCAANMEYLFNRCELYDVSYFFKKPINEEVLFKRLDEIKNECLGIPKSIYSFLNKA